MRNFGIEVATGSYTAEFCSTILHEVPMNLAPP